MSVLSRNDSVYEVSRTRRIREGRCRLWPKGAPVNEGAIERRGPKGVWRALSATVSSQIYGPHFEYLAREWVARHASEKTLGGMPRMVGPTVVSDPQSRREMEIDVVATAGGKVLALGEAKWTSGSMGIDVLADLERKRALLGERAKTAKLLLFGRGQLSESLDSVGSAAISARESVGRRKPCSTR